MKIIANRPCLPLPHAMAILLWCCSLGFSVFAQESKWTEEHAKQWYADQPFLVGANFLPSNAVNELEMWQADTFDPRRNRSRIRVGRTTGHEHHARVPAQPVVGPGFVRIPKTDRPLSLSLQPSITSGPSSCFSIPAGIQIRSSVRSVRRFPACITRVGCRRPEQGLAHRSRSNIRA